MDREPVHSLGEEAGTLLGLEEAGTLMVQEGPWGICLTLFCALLQP